MDKLCNIELKFNKQQGRNEASVTAVLLSKLRSIKRSWWYKIPDIGNKTKPLDIIGNTGGRFVCIEVKHDNKLKKMPDDIYGAILSKCEPHQIMTLEQNHRAGGLSYIAGYFKVLNQLLIYKWRPMH